MTTTPSMPVATPPLRISSGTQGRHGKVVAKFAGSGQCPSNPRSPRVGTDLR